MATASLNPSYSGLRDNGSTEAGILPSKTGLADQRLEWKRVLEASIWRCDSICMERQRTPVRGSSPQSTSWVGLVTVSYTMDAAFLAQLTLHPFFATCCL